MAIETKIRLAGTCPCCGGQFKTKNGLLVHHGYKRPGWGYIVGDCWSVGREAHEISPTTAMGYLDFLKVLEGNNLRAIKALPEAASLAEEKREWSHEARGYVTSQVHHLAGTPEFERVLKGLIANRESTIREIRRDMERLSGLIATWEPRQLMTLEEMVETSKAAKQAEKARLAAEEAERASEKARLAPGLLVRKIKKALRGLDFAALASCWRYDVGGLARDCNMTEARFLKATGMDKVFGLFGLKPGKANRAANEMILQTLKECQTDCSGWPEGSSKYAVQVSNRELPRLTCLAREAIGVLAK